VVVLVSGDGDFIDLVEYLKHHGRQVECLAFRETASSKLVEVVDDFTDLSNDLERYLIKPPRGGRRPRGPRAEGEQTSAPSMK
jgi:uncharacterized LabA/DUF88 family protein